MLLFVSFLSQEAKELLEKFVIGSVKAAAGKAAKQPTASVSVTDLAAAAAADPSKPKVGLTEHLACQPGNPNAAELSTIRCCKPIGWLTAAEAVMASSAPLAVAHLSLMLLCLTHALCCTFPQTHRSCSSIYTPFC